MVTSLAAAIESTLDLKVELIEGHDGIYEVSVDNEVVYTNMGQCSQGFPKDGQIVEQIGRLIGVTPDSRVSSSPVETNGGCECGSGDSVLSSGTECCVPSVGKPTEEEDSTSSCC